MREDRLIINAICQTRHETDTHTATRTDTAFQQTPYITFHRNLPNSFYRQTRGSTQAEPKSKQTLQSRFFYLK